MKHKIELVFEGTTHDAETLKEQLASLLSEGWAGAEENKVEFLEAGLTSYTEKDWAVTVYETDRAYGGPQEGGWWYDTGYPVEEERYETKWFYTEGGAKEFAKGLNELLDESEEWNNDGCNRDLSSVCCEGRYRAILTNGKPRPYPSEYPTYE